ncbi:MAG: ankyrin repeat domain-containing protein [Alphaproteobacteria bacterium]|nr:ankyrin repeat domain-containing protein [Alphaproteobacteria bacterium]
MERLGEMTKGLLKAINERNWREIKRLVHLGGNLNAAYDPFGNTPFLYAMHIFKKAEEIERLIKLGGDVTYKNRVGKTALMIAVENGCEPITPWVMVDYGADINAQDALGNTALMICLESRLYTKKLLYALIDYGADLTNLKNKEGKTAFDILYDELE